MSKITGNLPSTTRTIKPNCISTWKKTLHKPILLDFHSSSWYKCYFYTDFSVKYVWKTVLPSMCRHMIQDCPQHMAENEVQDLWHSVGLLRIGRLSWTIWFLKWLLSSYQSLLVSAIKSPHHIKRVLTISTDLMSALTVPLYRHQAACGSGTLWRINWKTHAKLEDTVQIPALHICNTVGRREWCWKYIWRSAGLHNLMEYVAA